MKYDNLQTSEIEMLEVEKNQVVKKKGARRKKAKNFMERDTLDFVMIQTGIAVSILALLLVINVMAVGFEPIKAVFTGIASIFHI